MKNVVFALFYFLIGTSVSAQTKIEFLQRAKDYINTEYTILILNSSLPNINKEAAKKITAILNKNSLEQPFTYEDIATILDGKFDSAILDFTLKADQIKIADLSPLHPHDALEKLNDEVYYLSRQSFNTLVSHQHKKNLYEEIATQLDTVKDEQGHTALTTNDDIKKTPENYYPSSIKGLWILIAFALAVGVIVYCFVRIDRLKAQLIDARQTINNLKTNKKDEKGKLLPVYNEFRTLVTNKLKQYEENLLKLQKKIEEQNTALQKTETEKIQTGGVAQKDAKVLYMGAPSGNCFPANVQTESKQNAFYKLLLKDDGKVATFEVINDGASLSEAIAHYSFYFEPACFATNKPTADASKIITSFPGVASLDGDKWTIKQKAIILFA